MQCELCGKKVDTVKYVIVDGARMMVCENCAKLGVPAPPPAEKRLQEVSWKRRISKTDEKIFQSMNRVLVPDWAEKIKEGRIKKGWTREELSAKVGEPVNAIAKMRTVIFSVIIIRRKGGYNVSLRPRSEQSRGGSTQSLGKRR